MITRWIDFLYPPRCQVCDCLLDLELFRGQTPCSAFSEKTLSLHSRWLTSGLQWFCNDCHPLRSGSLSYASLSPWPKARLGTELAVLEQGCCKCGSAIMDAEPVSADFSADHWSRQSGRRLCPVCAYFPMQASQVISLFTYTPEWEAVIKAYKYGKRRGLSSWLSDLLIDSLPIFFPDRPPACLVPVPSSSITLRTRGFHHIYLLAARIGNACGCPVHPLALRSNRKRKPQALLPVQERAENMKNAFRATCNFSRYSEVVLLDDVITSGATIQEATNVLLEHGAKDVKVLSLARSGGFSKLRVKGMLGRTLHHSSSAECS